MREHIISRVIELRKEINVTQEDLAKAVKVSRQTIIAIEKGNYIPSLLLGLIIARFFKKPVEEVFIYKQSFSANKDEYEE
jgi:putative transcriptional regulator